MFQRLKTIDTVVNYTCKSFIELTPAVKNFLHTGNIFVWKRVGGLREWPNIITVNSPILNKRLLCLELIKTRLLKIKIEKCFSHEKLK